MSCTPNAQVLSSGALPFPVPRDLSSEVRRVQALPSCPELGHFCFGYPFASLSLLLSSSRVHPWTAAWSLMSSSSPRGGPCLRKAALWVWIGGSRWVTGQDPHLGPLSVSSYAVLYSACRACDPTMFPGLRLIPTGRHFMSSLPSLHGPSLIPCNSHHDSHA